MRNIYSNSIEYLQHLHCDELSLFSLPRLWWIWFPSRDKSGRLEIFLNYIITFHKILLPLEYKALQINPFTAFSEFKAKTKYSSIKNAKCFLYNLNYIDGSNSKYLVVNPSTQFSTVWKSSTHSMTPTILSLLAIILFVGAVNSLGDCMGNISLSEFQGLQSLFDSTQGNNWLWNPTLPLTTHWHFNTTTPTDIDLYSPCQDVWQGVNCSFSNLLLPMTNQGLCTVQNISLQGMNLVGSIPSTLSQCSNVEVTPLILKWILLGLIFEFTYIDIILVFKFSVWINSNTAGIND